MNSTFIKQTAGIDISKSDFKVCLSVLDRSLHLSRRGSHTFENTPGGFDSLLQWLEKRQEKDLPVSITMEATGVYYEHLAYFLYRNHFRVHVVLPGQAKKYMESLGVRLKTDRTDALHLSDMGIERTLRVWQPLTPNLQQLRNLTRERSRIVCERTGVSNQLHAYRHQAHPNPGSVRRAAAQTAFLDRQIKDIEKEIASLVKQDKALDTKLGYMCSIPGVGLITAAIIAAETNGFATITGIKQLSSFAGMDVQIAESGKWKGRSKISKKGNAHIRQALYMPTLSRVKYDRTVKAYFQRLKARKGTGMVALVAAQRKLLGLMYTLWKKEERYRAPEEEVKKVEGEKNLPQRRIDTPVTNHRWPSFDSANVEKIREMVK